MAAKIKEGIRDLTLGVVDRLKGPKYADNLLGDSLLDQLRKATAKDLLQPSEEMNSQVVDTINQDIANGKDSKDIVNLLKKRLRTDNPQKQWLAVQLVGRVMRDCSGAIGLHQEELLREVAAVMTRPARIDTEAGRTTRKAAKELLRSYGRAGTSAFRAAHRTGAGGGNALAGHPSLSHPDAAMAAVDAAASAEASSVVAEVQQLIEQAHANTELLSEMLVAEQRAAGWAGGSGEGAGAGPSAGGDEFENELTKELVTEVRELRGLFDAYLEQMQSMSDPAVEATLIRALEAVDLLDGALALQKDVASNQLELEQQATAGSGSGGAAAAAAAGRPSGAAAPAPATAAGASTQGDLISLDDFCSLPQPPPVLGGAAPAAAPYDPFAASDNVPTHPVGSPPAGAAAPHTAPQQPPAYPAATTSHQQPPPRQPQYQPLQQQPQQQQQQPPMYGIYSQQPHPHVAQQPLQHHQYGAYSHAAAQPYGSAAAHPGVGALPYNNPFSGGGAAMPSTAAYRHPAGLHAPPQQGTVGGPSGSSNPFAAAPAPPPQQPLSVPSDWDTFFADRAK
ncbi:hypothetical protein Agub_g15333 [Astrephomene gubernaculifera]|uniref:VHS domain-containing protein n=1 Tax=Astrephomene gubernaculifera TaxID=47775 RepID=A0AAD3E5B3_9CHLO|nr:hypothetical protein Agub_g15333 [Astrephomene gubernaculifera]